MAIGNIRVTDRCVYYSSLELCCCTTVVCMSASYAFVLVKHEHSLPVVLFFIVLVFSNTSYFIRAPVLVLCLTSSYR
jgi:ABC-type spermidine/putrescine transport system permease subunit I